MTEHTEKSQDRYGVLVGYDGSKSADCALAWAAREAQRTGLDLTIVTAYTSPAYTLMGLEAAVVPVEDDALQLGAVDIAQDGRKKAAEHGVDAHAFTAHGDAAGVLRDLSERAEMLVLGARGRGGFMGLLVGSTASAVPAHAKCPSVIVPTVCGEGLEAKPGREDVVVVGVDGSERGRLAALLAAERALGLGYPLRLVCALPHLTTSVAWVPPAESVESMRSEVTVHLRAARDWLLSHFPDLEIQTEILEGVPAKVLTEMSSHVALTVVGARGGGGFVGMLLGSTSQSVLSQARGPIMVVPERGEDPRLANRPDFGPTPRGF
ncbi:universal stress protein [Falsarthrobacter nasiphocae]|uniref:Nucleotide-binding universal stress UspA family protein n=1 Tax=Falsarthrobacter nasiphocae TaxID=189863 RepID=A0AAE3YEG3_9MICC|nr:universal stress protein [Falsarthrobacter nasiphocae]MDR6891899.1 nucleotide-binding universal stress UspA family protein [Falsarthrobacter nasiphocae]